MKEFLKELLFAIESILVVFGIPLLIAWIIS